MYLDQVRNSVAETPEWLQAVVTALWGAVPYVEGEFAAVLAVIAGVPVVLAIIAAIIGNVVSVLLVIHFSDKIRSFIFKNKQKKDSSEKMQRVKKVLKKYGVPGASLLGPLVTGTQGTAFLLIATGADKANITRWTIVAIVLWTVTFGVLAYFGVDFVLNHVG